jgi:hypothetical protein
MEDTMKQDLFKRIERGLILAGELASTCATSPNAHLTIEDALKALGALKAKEPA